MLTHASSTLQRGSEPVYDTEQSAVLADWLATVFVAPLRDDALRALRQTGKPDLLGEIGLMLDCPAVAHRMQQAVCVIPFERAAAGLACRYTTLFEGVSGRRTVSLCESLHHDQGTRLFQAPFVAMQGILRKLDVSVDKSFAEPADHVSVELAALALALRAGDCQTALALRKRLAEWAPRIARRLDIEDPGGFYAGAATMLVAFTAHQPESLPPTTRAKPAMQQAHSITTG